MFSQLAVCPRVIGGGWGNDDPGRSCLSSLAGAESEYGNLGSLQSQNGALEMRGQHNRERAAGGCWSLELDTSHTVLGG